MILEIIADLYLIFAMLFIQLRGIINPLGARALHFSAFLEKLTTLKNANFKHGLIIV